MSETKPKQMVLEEEITELKHENKRLRFVLVYLFGLFALIIVATFATAMVTGTEPLSALLSILKLLKPPLI